MRSSRKIPDAPKLIAAPPTSAPPTPEEKRAAADRLLFRSEKQAREELAAFTESLAKHPYYAFSWGSDAVEAAATLQVLMVAKGNLAKGHSIASIRETALREALRAARCPERSTAPLANFAAQALAQAWANLGEMLEGLD